MVNIRTRVERRPVVAGDPPGRLEAVQLGHPDVHQDHVRPLAPANSTAACPSAASPTTSMSSAAPQQDDEPAAHQRLVVGDGHPDHIERERSPQRGEVGVQAVRHELEQLERLVDVADPMSAE